MYNLLLIRFYTCLNSRIYILKSNFRYNLLKNYAQIKFKNNYYSIINLSTSVNNFLVSSSKSEDKVATSSKELET